MSLSDASATPHKRIHITILTSTIDKGELPVSLRRVLLLSLFVFAGCATQHRLAQSASSESTFSQLDAMAQKEVESSNVPSIAFAVANEKGIVHEGAFGWADKEHQLRATPNTPYPLASATKPLMATTIEALAERGLIDLDAPASKYLRGSEPTANYTVRQLLHHTAGLPTYASIAWGGTTKPAAHLHQYAFAAYPPGAVCEYSNLGFGLLGEIAANVTGRPLDVVLRETLFQPLQMQNSMLIDSFDERNVAKKYDAAGAALVPTYNDTPGAGNAYSSAHDLALFGMFQLGARGNVLKAATRRKMWSESDPHAIYSYYDAARYGSGWYFRGDATGETSVAWHEGGMPGASAIIVLVPKAKLVATVVINANDKNDVAQRVANALLQSVDAKLPAFAFEATAGFQRFAEESLRGEWEGSVAIDGTSLPCTLRFDENGGSIEFPSADGELLPHRASFQLLTRDGVVLATIPGTLPGHDVPQRAGGYILLRLLRQGTQLDGALVAYGTEERLEYLLPYRGAFRRK